MMVRPGAAVCATCRKELLLGEPRILAPRRKVYHLDCFERPRALGDRESSGNAELPSPPAEHPMRQGEPTGLN